MRYSLDEMELRVYDPKPALPDTPAVASVALEALTPGQTQNGVVSLDGIWDMVQDGNYDRAYGDWENIIPAKVPGSVHAALQDAGVIPDPTFGKNDAIAREKSDHTWWFRKTFPRPFGDAPTRLTFGGVCERCNVFLNGRFVGYHRGMFGGPEFDITDLLQDKNDLRVMVLPVPKRIWQPGSGELTTFFKNMNIGWSDTAVFNCCYGWHYANIPALGIWQSVKLEKIPQVEMIHPYASVKDLSGAVDLCMELQGPEGGFTGTIEAILNGPDGALEQTFAVPVSSKSMKGQLHTVFHVENPKLWWPNDLGPQNLYHLTLRFVVDGVITDEKEFDFGIRTVKTVPIAGCEPDEKTYNWQFIINDKPVFLKGANWCTLDFAMRFTKERYDRFLSLARDQHLQLVRAWGGGLPETEEFYDLANRYGVMVLQEFPTAWDSQKVQPADVLTETVERAVKRIRKHPALAMWCGGNESAEPTDIMIDMMGRAAYGLDGTRVFHRNDPWGGSSHNYSVYWGYQDFDFNLHYVAPFIGEFGFASSPNKESVQKYVAPSDFEVWPEVEGGNVSYHTPVYNNKDDMKILHRYTPEFLPDTSLDNMIVSSQISQSVTLRNTLELARTRIPDASGICYYKLTDVWPAVSWSTIDWYGVPKMAYYFCQDSFEPLHACVLLDTFNPRGKAQELPVHILDDADALAGKSWTVNVRAYGADLKLRLDGRWTGEDSIDRAKKLGILSVDEKTAAEAPLMIVVELLVDGKLHGRTFYWLNFHDKVGCLFDLPKTTLKLEKQEGKAVITNTGDVPAVAVNFICGKISDKFTPADNFVWIEAGETIEIATDRDDYEGITAWNV